MLSTLRSSIQYILFFCLVMCNQCYAMQGVDDHSEVIQAGEQMDNDYVLDGDGAFYVLQILDPFSIKDDSCCSPDSFLGDLPCEVWQKIFLVNNAFPAQELISVLPSEFATLQWRVLHNLKTISLVSKGFNYCVRPFLQLCIDRLELTVKQCGGKQKFLQRAFLQMQPLLHLAYWQDLRDMCLAMKIDVNNDKDTFLGKDLLGNAMFFKQSSQIICLLELGANANQRDNFGNMFIDVACQKGLNEIACMLKLYGGDPEDKYELVDDALVCRNGVFGYAYGNTLFSMNSNCFNVTPSISMSRSFGNSVKPRTSAGLPKAKPNNVKPRSGGASSRVRSTGASASFRTNNVSSRFNNARSQPNVAPTTSWLKAKCFYVSVVGLLCAAAYWFLNQSSELIEDENASTNFVIEDDEEEDNFYAMELNFKNE